MSALTVEGPAGADVLVFANSLAATRTMWDAQCAAWQAKHRLVRFDYAGHGEPGFSGSVPTTIEGIAQDLLAQLDAAGIQRFSLIGLSLGGMLGLQLAATAPERVSRLVAANCRYHAVPALLQQWNDRIAAVRERGMEAIADATVERWLTADYRMREPAQAAAVRTMICSTSRAGYAAAAQAVRDFDARPLLNRIACPVLLVSGAQDAAAPTDHMAVLAAELGARHEVLDPCAHLSSVERADSFTAAVGHFIS